MDPKRKIMRAVAQTLAPIERPVLEVNGKKFVVRNLSLDGLGLWLGTEPWPAVLIHQSNAQKALSALLIISTKAYPCEVTTIHLSGVKVGLRFIAKTKELETALSRLLEPSVQAGWVVAHPLNLQLDEAKNEPVLWYEGLNGSSIKVWFNENSGLISELGVTFAGNELRRQFQKPMESNLSETSAHHAIEQFLAALPMPLPGILLWQFLETGEQVYLPEKLRQSKQVA